MSKDNAESKLKIWFNDHIKESREDLLTVGTSSNVSLMKNLDMFLGSDEQDPTSAMSPIAFYAIVFNSILKFLKSKQKKHDYYYINFADRFEIGYNGDSDDEDSEKVGTFAISMHSLNPSITSNKMWLKDEIEEDDIDERDSLKLAAEWNSRNIIECKEEIGQIQLIARDDLDKYIKIHSTSSEFITPVFCFIHDAIVDHVKNSPAKLGIETGEFEMTVAGIYTIGVRLDADNVPEIYYIMSSGVRQAFKDDGQKEQFSVWND